MAYTGVFFEKELTDNGKLDRKIKFPHVTHEFIPKEINKELLGQVVIFKVVGYGINENNEGLLVEVAEGSREILEAFSKVEKPHITLSVSNNGKPVDTKELDFKPCTPWYIGGVYGVYKKGKVLKK